MANKRIYYAIQQVNLGRGGNGGNGYPIHGLQSVGVSTNFSLEQVFELGQLEIYQNVEEVPEVEVTLNKVLDGYPPIYLMATQSGGTSETGNSLAGTDPANPADLAKNITLAGRQNARCDVKLGIFTDAKTAAEQGEAALQTLLCRGMYVSSVSYTFPVDGNFTEDVTLVGNSKEWHTASSNFTPLTGGFLEATPDGPADASTGLFGKGTVGRRQFLDIPNCLFPIEIPGVQGDGTLADNGSTGDGFSTHFQNITVSCDLGRESINELGRFAPYHRYATFPIEVTSEFEVLSIDGDGISATEEGYWTGDPAAPTVATGAEPKCQLRYNLRDQTIIIKTCEGLTLDLGTKNKLTSVNYSGGDTGGGNVTVSYSYSTYNKLDVDHIYTDVANASQALASAGAVLGSQPN
jgi:hypothetical protein